MTRLVGPGAWSGRGRAGARLAAVAAAAALLFTACSNGTSGTTPAGSAATRPGSALPAKPATSTADGRVLGTIDGTSVRVPSGKPSVLAFIAVGCADCAAAAKAAGQASQSLGGSATVLGVDLDPGVPASELHSFLDYVGAKGLPVVIDDAKFTLMKTYAVSALSTVLIVNPAGKVTFRAVNPSARAIEAAVHAAS